MLHLKTVVARTGQFIQLETTAVQMEPLRKTGTKYLGCFNWASKTCNFSDLW